jgi:hypothetical protein
MTNFNIRAASMFLAGIVACWVFNQRVYDHSNKKQTRTSTYSLSSLFAGGGVMAMPEPEESSGTINGNLESDVAPESDLTLKRWEGTKNAVVIGVAGGSGSGDAQF